MTELLVGTRKGLVVLRGPRGGAMEVAARSFPGEVVEYAIRDPRSKRYFASVTMANSGRTCSTPTTPPASGSRPRDRRSSPTPARPSNGSGSSSPASATASCGAAWRPPHCFTAAMAARPGTWCSRCGTYLSEPSGTPALAGSACTRSARGRATTSAWRSASRPEACGSRRMPARAGGGRSRSGAALPAGGSAAGHAYALRAQHEARAAAALDHLHAVPRRRVPVGRRRRELDRHRYGRGCPPISDFRWPSTHTIPTGRSSFRWRPMPTA